MSYSVSTMAKLLNLAPSTLRFYDKIGLLPFVKRSGGGMRIFDHRDYEWLQIIECLKRAGMQLTDIQKYLDLVMKGDDTIEERLELLQRQREIVEKQMEDLQETLDTLNFKCWYYETAKEAGTTAVPREMLLEEIPEEHRKIREKLTRIPTVD